MGRQIERFEPQPTIFPAYTETYNRIAATLRKGGEVPRKLSIGILGYKNLQPNYFALRDRDFQNLYQLPPGKSCFIDFTNDVIEASCVSLRRYPHDDHHIHIITVERILGANWRAFYTPTNQNNLHVRIVPKSFLSGDREDFEVSEYDKVSICNAGWERVVPYQE